MVSKGARVTFSLWYLVVGFSDKNGCLIKLHSESVHTYCDTERIYKRHMLTLYLLPTH